MEEIKRFEPVFGEWYVDAFIGAGSFGKVYRIYREELGERQYSALKHFSIPQDDKDIVQRQIEGMDDKSIAEYYTDMVNSLKTEIKLMKKMQGNTNIVCYEDSRILPKRNGMGYDVFIRMELLTALTTRLAAGPMYEDEVKKLGMDICSALEACRENEIIHRDIKPDNIFIDNRGNYKLGDFGISRQLEKTATFMSKKGTYNYMAPEVYKGERYGAAADIYSLGIVMYNLLNGGRVPFLPLAPNPITLKDREYAVVRRMRGDRFPLPCNAQIELGEAVLKACAFNPYDRYRSAEDFKWAIAEAGNDEQIDLDKTLAMFGEKPSFNAEQKKPAPQVAAPPVRPVNPQGGYVPQGRPVNPQGGYVPQGRPVNPQGGYVPQGRPVNPQGGYVPQGRPVNPQGGYVPQGRPVKPQGGYVPQGRPVNPQGGYVPQGRPVKPQGGYVPQGRPVKPQGGYVPQGRPVKPHGGSVPQANSTKPADSVNTPIKWFMNDDPYKPSAAKKEKSDKRLGPVIARVVITVYVSFLLILIMVSLSQNGCM